jgi:hypothetical protein
MDHVYHKVYSAFRLVPYGRKAHHTEEPLKISFLAKKFLKSQIENARSLAYIGLSN